MNKQLERLRRMHSLIKFKRTGTPSEFAERLGISQAGLYRSLAQMKALGAPIHFCQTRQSYTYYESVELRIDFVRVGNDAGPSSGQASIRSLVSHPSPNSAAAL